MRRKDRELVDRGSQREILEGSDVCRLAFAVGGEPYIVALNFGYEWEGPLPVLYFHCAREGRKLDMMRSNPRICFELDNGHVLSKGEAPCDWGMSYSSLVGYGVLRELEDETEQRAGLERLLRHYGWGGEGDFQAGALAATAVLRLDVAEMTGKLKR